MKYINIDLPEELSPSEEMILAAKEHDEAYIAVYEQLHKDHTASIAIGLLARVITEKVALSIGSSLNTYDKEILMGIIERYIAQIVFRG